MRRITRQFIFAAAALSAALPATAAEICLKALATAHGGVVHLGDVADVHGSSADDARQLAQVELFSMPAEERYVTARQVREALLDRGVDLRRHTICGASIIELAPGETTGPPAVYARPAIGGQDQPGDPRRQPLVAAIIRFLKKHVEAELPWQVELAGGDVPEAAEGEVAVVQSERRPQPGSLRAWLGPQQFVIRRSAAGRKQETIVAAEIKLPPTIVVAARDLPRGAVLDAADVKSRPASGQDRPAQGTERFEFPEDVVSKQLTRPLRAGQPIEAESIEAVELVRRGERVAIVVNHHGVRVRTEGRARDSGGLGDTVLVESASRRNAFQAVVTGVNEVQIEVGRASVAERPRREQWR
jgi:flagella basal body P-ring formation protein FlgA